MKPINVLYLIRSWAFGGSHTIILLLMKHLARARFNVTCVPFDTASGADEAFIAEARKRGLSVAAERIPWRTRLNWMRARRTILELVKEYDIDLIHTHDTHSTVLVGVGRERWPCACVASAYGWWNSLLPLRRPLYQWIERDFALLNFDRVITVSDHMKGKILRRRRTPEDRIRVIRTGLDLAAVPARADGARVRVEFGIPPDACVIGTVSRVSAEKGHCHLLDAAQRLVATLGNVRLLIVGDGPARGALEAQAARLGIADHVTFTGFYDDLRAALAAMDIFAQPSVLEEGFPTSVLEAQAAGLPVVASDVGGTSETMDVPATGLLAPPGDAPALADALESLVRDPVRRRAMGEAARPWIERSFTLEHMIEQVGSAYEEALDCYRKRSASGQKAT